MSKWHVLAQDNLNVVTENGFDVPTWENFPVKAMLIVTELDEALSSLESRVDDPWPEELADLWIRISGVLQGIWPNDWSVRFSDTEMGLKDPKPLPHGAMEPLWDVLHWVCTAVEYWRHDQAVDAKISMEMALRKIVRLAHATGVNTDAEVRKKAKKNAERGRFHGKAKASG